MLLTLAAVLVLAACNGSDDDAPAEPEAGEPSAAADDDPAPASDDGDAAPSGDGGDTDGTASDDPADDADEHDDGGSPFRIREGTLELDEIMEAHPRGAPGVQLAVTRVTVEPMAILVDIELLNGWTQEFSLAAEQPRLEDNTGRVYEYVPPAENQRLTTPAGGSLSATLAFHGALAPDAERFDLTLNRWGGHDTHPTITLEDLPLPADD